MDRRLFGTDDKLTIPAKEFSYDIPYERARSNRLRSNDAPLHLKKDDLHYSNSMRMGY